MRVNRWVTSFWCRRPPMKWETKDLLSSTNEWIKEGLIFVNHCHVDPFKVVGKALHMISSGKL